MKKKLLLSLIVNFSGFLIAVEQNVTLVSKNGHEFTIPKKAALFSQVIKNMVGKSPGKKIEKIWLAYDDQALQNITSILSDLDLQLQKQLYERLKKKELIQRDDGELIAKNLQGLVNTVLMRQGKTAVIHFINACNTLEIPSLINAGAKIYIEKNPPTRPWKNLIWLLKEDFPQELFIYFKKHFMLRKAGAKEELSIADYIALYGQPKVIMIGSTTKISLEINLNNKKITSLFGLDQIKNAEKIKSLKLSSNFILGNKNDPEFPERPFKNFTKLEYLWLTENLLKSITPQNFIGANQLKELRLEGNPLTRRTQDRLRYHFPIRTTSVKI